jgi:hypothetical protein
MKSVSHSTVRRLLRKLGYSLRANVKRLSGPPHPDRDRQFRYMQRKQREFGKAGQPVISADAKSSKLIGNFKNDGSLWCEEADEVNAYDFRTDAEYRAVPYGVYDVAARRGHVNVGISGNTGEFSVNSIRVWWNKEGRRRYPDATRLLIKVDGGGSNGWRPRLWKRELQRFADESGLQLARSDLDQLVRSAVAQSRSAAECDSRNDERRWPESHRATRPPSLRYEDQGQRPGNEATQYQTTQNLSQLELHNHAENQYGEVISLQVLTSTIRSTCWWRRRPAQRWRQR